MTTCEALHQFVDQLPENRAELAHVWLQDLRDAAGVTRLRGQGVGRTGTVPYAPVLVPVTSVFYVPY